MLNIIKNMVQDIIKFSFIYLIILLIFGSSARIFFIKTPGFDSDSNTYITLFSATFGSFTFSNFKSDKMVLPDSYGYYFFILYLLISNIVLLNFIIAVISSTYTRLIGVSKALYLNEIVKVRNIFEFNKYYSGLISLPIPLNAILLPIYPFIILMKSKRLNHIVLHFSYLPVMMIGTLIFITLSIILWPISYLALLYQNFIDIWEKGSNGSNRCIEITQFLTMIFKAPFVLFGGIIIDTSKFIMSLYATKIRIHNERVLFKKFDFSKLDPEYFNLLKKILYKKRKLIDVKKLIREFGRELDIYTHLRNIIYQSHKHNTDNTGFDHQDYSTDSESENEEISPKVGIEDDSSLTIIKQYNL